MKSLIVFYSRSGNTRKIANEIAEKINGEIEEIIDYKSRKGIFGFMKCGYEAITKKLTKIKPLNKKIEDFDLIVIGSPTWAGNLSSPVRTFLTEYAKNIKKVAFFATAGAESEHVFESMQEISGKPLAIMEINEKEIKENNYLSKIDQFVAKLK